MKRSNPIPVAPCCSAADLEIICYGHGHVRRPCQVPARDPDPDVDPGPDVDPWNRHVHAAADVFRPAPVPAAADPACAAGADHAFPVLAAALPDAAGHAVAELRDAAEQPSEAHHVCPALDGQRLACVPPGA